MPWASATASIAAAVPCAEAWLGDIAAQPHELLGAWRPTYSGIVCHPAATSLAIQVELRLACGHARLAPPIWIPIARYGDAPHAAIAVGEGALQASKPRPPKTAAVGCAERDVAVRGAIAGCAAALAIVAVARRDGRFSARATTA